MQNQNAKGKTITIKAYLTVPMRELMNIQKKPVKAGGYSFYRLDKSMTIQRANQSMAKLNVEEMGMKMMCIDDTSATNELAWFQFTLRGREKSLRAIAGGDNKIFLFDWKEGKKLSITTINHAKHKIKRQ